MLTAKGHDRFFFLAPAVKNLSNSGDFTSPLLDSPMRLCYKPCHGLLTDCVMIGPARRASLHAHHIVQLFRHLGHA